MFEFALPIYYFLKMSSGNKALLCRCMWVLPNWSNMLSDLNLCPQAAMDSARLSAAKSSPMMETINMVSASRNEVSFFAYLRVEWFSLHGPLNEVEI